MGRPFVIWLTGLPGSGKSTVAAQLVKQLRRRDIDPALLESDVFRGCFTPHATYDEKDRELFYEGMVHVAELLFSHGVPVILDATANRRAYRALARKRIPAFIEVWVDCPLEICRSRDPKGLYAKADAGQVSTLPGVQTAYEPPEHAEIHLCADREEPDAAARRIVDYLLEVGLVPATRAREIR